MTDIEKQIYDEYVKDSQAVFAKTKAAAEAVGLEYQSIIGQVEKSVVKGEAWIVRAGKAVWTWLLAWTQFLDDKKGKFSYKRGAGVASLVTSLIFAFRGPFILAVVYLAAAVLIAWSCAIEQK